MRSIRKQAGMSAIVLLAVVGLLAVSWWVMAPARKDAEARDAKLQHLQQTAGPRVETALTGMQPPKTEAGDWTYFDTDKYRVVNIDKVRSNLCADLEFGPAYEPETPLSADVVNYWRQESAKAATQLTIRFLTKKQLPDNHNCPWLKSTPDGNLTMDGKILVGFINLTTTSTWK